MSAPPSKQARVNTGQEEEEGPQRGSPPSQGERPRRIPERRPSDEAPREVHPPRNLNTADEIVIDPQQAAGGAVRRFESRPRGNFRDARDAREPETRLDTCPANVVSTRCTDPNKYRNIKLLANFIKVEPMKDRHLCQYRVEYDPQIESRPLRRNLFREATKELFPKRPAYDGMHDFYNAHKLEENPCTVKVANPLEEGQMVALKITNVRGVDYNSFEMMRNYNIHMKRYLQLMEFYQITATGSWVHSDLATPVGDGKTLAIIRGFKTATNIYDGGNILVNLESVHKLMQRRNVLQVMTAIKSATRAQGDLRQNIKSELTGKLVITNYNKRIYRVEDVRFDIRPTDTFEDRRAGKPISYIEYFKTKHNEIVVDVQQPMLQVAPNNKRGKNERGEESNTKEILLVPELCNITGLTEEQRNDNRLKMDLIRMNQVPPSEKVKQMRQFMHKFHSNVDILAHLKEWGYNYDKDAVTLTAHVLPMTKIGFSENRDSYNPANPATGDFNVNELARIPVLDQMIILITRADLANKETIMGHLQRGFMKVKLRPKKVDTVEIKEGDSPSHYINYLRRIPGETTAVVVVMHNQNKEKYDAIKKSASVEQGIITQVITAKLMTDQRKAASAATKIAIQIAAKVGGEPWFSDIPLKNVMICGYDISRDTAKRGVTYGAFLASMNDQYSRWFSKASMYEQADQVSGQLAAALTEALKKYKEVGPSKQFPERIFLYREGAGEGQYSAIFKTELAKIQEALKQVSPDSKLIFIVVNKRTGARFFMQNGPASFANAPPGTAIDHTVTREGRYDFFLISQSTRAGTVAPTYYSIIHDDSAMKPEVHQMLAYKLTLMYYNWSGTVRVPAPCQYAQKLASLCGEHLHAQPNSVLNDRLHFL